MADRKPWHIDKKKHSMRISKGERWVWFFFMCMGTAVIMGIFARCSGLWKGF